MFFNISKNYPLEFGLFRSANDPEGDSIDYEIVYCYGPFHGAMDFMWFWDDDDEGMGAWYVPDANYVGEDEFVVTVSLIYFYYLTNSRSLIVMEEMTNF